MSAGAATTIHRVSTDDAVELHVEDTGEGPPIVFVHEFSADASSWEPQVRALSRRNRCVAFNARGYEPSDVPEDPDAYSQDRAVLDVLAVMDGLSIERAHLVGASMGAFTALHVARREPERARSVVLSGCGYGSSPESRVRFREECAAIAAAYSEQGSAAVAPVYAEGPARVQYQNKDPRGWAEFADKLARRNATGAALTVLGVQRERPSLHDLRGELGAMETPTLIVAGDEDDGVLGTSLMLKRTMRSSALLILPRSGHVCNLEEPDRFNQALTDFYGQVDAGRWAMRDSRSLSGSITGVGAEQS
ncbi:MAG: alpha/beta fold hydrolase [Solirubrobacterales bacterium]